MSNHIVHIKELLPDYLDNLLEENQKKIVEKHLKECDTCSEELANLKKLYNAFETEEKAAPPPSIKTNFLNQLEDEKRKQSKMISLDSRSISGKKPGYKSFLKIAASILLLIGTFFMGKWQSEEESNKEIAALNEEKLEFRQTAMLSLLENQSASKRIQGVNYIDKFSELDETIIKALANRMLYDENTNVRLTALEALSNFVDSEIVKSAFIKALETEKDPGIQIAIIKNLVKTLEDKDIGPMKKLMEQEETLPFVKNEINQVLSKII